VTCFALSFYTTGTLGQPKMWDITNPVSYQHPMAPYDVLVDPQTLPNMPKDGADEQQTPDDAKDTDKSNEVCNSWGEGGSHMKVTEGVVGNFERNHKSYLNRVFSA